MKIATILGAFSVGSRPLDLAAAHTSDRGMTGTELGFVRVTEELRKLGHDVTSFMGDAKARPEWDSYDALLNWNEPNLFIGCKGPKRVCYQMLNDFSFIQPGYGEWTDAYVGVSQKQADYVANAYPETKGKWSVVGLGCDPDLYSDQRVRGRVVFCSSPDRGLHWLLSVWPHIREAVPEAHLRIFYHMSDDLLDIDEHSVSPQGGPYHKHIQEIAQRKRYIKHAVEALKHLGVEHIGSVSRERMAKEWSEASALAYPCDTVAFSEGFSCSILEAHASYTAPIITDCDCLGEIYGKSGARMLPMPVNLKSLTGAVIEELRSPTDRSKCRAFAEERAWAKTAKLLEDHLR